MLFVQLVRFFRSILHTKHSFVTLQQLLIIGGISYKKRNIVILWFKKTRMKVGVFHVELQAGLSKSRPSVVDSKNKLLAFASVIIKFWLFHGQIKFFFVLQFVQLQLKKKILVLIEILDYFFSKDLLLSLLLVEVVECKQNACIFFSILKALFSYKYGLF